MAFCANCGQLLIEGTGFCISCGKAVGPQKLEIAPPQEATSSRPTNTGGSGLTSNLAGALAYLLGFITGIVFLVLNTYKSDRFVRFHAMQSILFSMSCLVFWIAWGIVWRILFSITGFSLFLDLPLSLLISLGIFLFWLFVMYQAYNQREYRIPFIGQIAARQLG